MGLLLMLCLIVTSVPTDPDMARAISLFETADLPRAEALLEVLLKRATITPADRVLATKYLAATQFAMGNAEGAEKQIDDLVALKADETFDPLVFDPKLSELLTKARAAAEAHAAAKQPPSVDAVVEAKPDPGDLPPPSAVEEAATPTAPPLASERTETTQASEVRAARPSGMYALIPAGVAVGALGFAALKYSEARAFHEELINARPRTEQEGNDASQRGTQAQTVAAVAVGVGVAAAGAAVALYLWPESPTTEVSLTIAPGSVGVVGAF